MNKIIRYIQTYLIIGFPFVITCMLWQILGGTQKEIVKDASLITRVLWDMLGWNIMLWFAMLIVFLFLLVAIPSAREKTLRRLANLKERDEREEYITGKASRAAYIATLSLMIFFLFFSMFSFNVYSIPQDQAINGKRTAVGISFGYSLLNKPDVENTPTPKQEMLFSSKNVSLSTSSIIFILLSWQLLIFNLAARKEQMKGLQD